MAYLLQSTTIELLQGDITSVTTDALVNATDMFLSGSGGLDAAIHQAGGPELVAECRAIGRCEVGSAVITTGGKLSARYVIHAVTPQWNDGRSGELRKLQSAYLRCLELTEERHHQSVAFPSLGTGRQHIPFSAASSIALQTAIEYIQQHRETSLRRILFVLRSENDLQIYQQKLSELTPIVANHPSDVSNSATRLQPGDTVGVYIIQRYLSKGAFNEIYEARYREFGESVLLMIVRTDRSDSNSVNWFEVFTRGAEKMKLLAHRTIAPLRESGRRPEDGRAYLVLGYVEGDDLEAVLRRTNGFLATAEVDRMVTQIAAALDYAHSKGILHLDLRPQNILLGRDGQVRIVEFGLVQSYIELAELGTIIGTAAYMAPEQIEGKPEYRSDLYQLGITTYQLLTGRTPFQGSMQQPSPGLRQLNSQIASAVEAVVLKMLSKKPEDRYQSASAFAQALHEAIQPQKTGNTTPALAGLGKALYEGDSVGNYIIDSYLGRGGMGAVYKAHHQHLGWQACVKIILTEGDDAENFALFANYFQQEAKLLATLEHPNIVRIKDFGTRREDGLAYLVMDYIEGGDLTLLLRQAKGPLPAAEVDAIIAQIAAGLHYAHEKKVMHRDLKPQNILRRSSGELVIADFGLARAMENTLTKSGRTSTSQTSSAGTPAYMAPEHCKGSPEYRSDLYALGVMTYEMLAGRLPFQGSPLQIMFAHVNQAPPALCEVNPNVPSAVEAVVMKMLAKTPADRYESATAFAQAFHKALQPDKISRGNSLQPGDSVGSYIIDERLGAGGFGEVFKAHHRKLPWQVCVKITRPDRSGETDFARFADLFEREAKVLATLTHPNIVVLKDYDTRAEDNLAYLVMDFVDGGDLSLMLATAQGPLAPENVVDIITQAAAGLDYAHGKKIIHRDLKPQNILRYKDGRLVIADFGLAKDIGKSPEYSTSIKGTLSYMAPEQLDGRPEASSDLYALGIIAYQLLTGTVPFKGALHQVMQAHTHQPPPPLRQFNTQVSPAVEAIVLKMLSKAPADRYESATIFAQALHEAIRFVPAITPPPASFRLLQTIPAHQGRVLHVAWSPHGNYFCTASSDNTIAFWTSTTYQRLLAFTRHSQAVSCVAWSPVAPLVATASDDRTVRLVETATGKQVHSIAGHSDEVWHVTWSRDGQMLASSSKDGTLRLWLASTGVSIVTPIPHTTWVSAAAWSPDGRYLASACWDGLVRLWVHGYWQQMRAFPSFGQPVTSISWSPDSKLLAAAYADNSVRVWNSEQFVLHCTLPMSAPPNQVAWSPDGRFVAVTLPQAAEVWNVATGSLVARLTGHTGLVWSVAWSPVVRLLATTSYDGTVRMWG